MGREKKETKRGGKKKAKKRKNFCYLSDQNQNRENTKKPFKQYRMKGFSKKVVVLLQTKIG